MDHRAARRFAALAPLVPLLLGNLATSGINLPPDAAATQLRRSTVKELATRKLLVAARRLMDPNFSSTVILLVEYGREGAMGLVRNRPTPVAIARVLPGLQQSPSATATLYIGGPVTPSAVHALSRSEGAPADCGQVRADVWVMTTRASLDAAVTAGSGPDRFRVYAGYAGWGAGQLADETTERSWHVLDGDAAVVVDRDPTTLWPRQIKRTEVISAKSSRQPVEIVAASHFLDVNAAPRPF
jgi:putative transcriptional regulator